MDAFNEMIEKMGDIYRLYGAEDRLRTAVVPGGHGDNEVIRLPVYAFFLKEFLGIDTTLTEQGPVDTLSADQLVCWQDGYPLDERLTSIDEVLVPVYSVPLRPLSRETRDKRIHELTRLLWNEVFRYFPREACSLKSEWGKEKIVQGRNIRNVSFNSFQDMHVRGVYSLPDVSGSRSGLPAVLVLDHRRGIPVWGNKQSLEGNRWGDRAVLVIETLDYGSRALERNLRSFNDDDLRHHMRRQAMVAGTTLEAMQMYEVLRSLEFLRSMPEIDKTKITIIGKGEVGINGLYAALLDGEVERVILNSPPVSHRQGPCYLGILRFTDIPEVIALMQNKVKLYGEIPLGLQLFLAQTGLDQTMLIESLTEGINK